MENNKAIEKKDAVEKKEKSKKSGKPNFFKRIWIKIKEVVSELKKVTWPSFGKVVKQTGVVIAVVAVFLIVITLMDWGLTAALKQLIK